MCQLWSKNAHLEVVRPRLQLRQGSYRMVNPEYVLLLSYALVLASSVPRSQETTLPPRAIVGPWA